MTLAELLTKYIEDQEDAKRFAKHHIDVYLAKELESAKLNLIKIEKEIADKQARIATADECIRLLSIAKEAQ